MIYSGPAILLGRMAVDRRRQGNGLGAAMLKHFITKALEVSEIVGVRLVLVHAKDQQTSDFCRHHGFVESPIDTLTWIVSWAGWRPAGSHGVTPPARAGFTRA
ncbi:MAG: GNAT family N-acetyltransferase [Solirubrobacteraceae bacterium]